MDRNLRGVLIALTIIIVILFAAGMAGHWFG